MEYKLVGTHVETLDEGQMIAPGETIDLEDIEAQLPRNAELIEEGLLIEAAGTPDATEAAKTLAQENNISLSAVTGTGSEGTITKGDVEGFIAAQEGGS